VRFSNTWRLPGRTWPAEPRTNGGNSSRIHPWDSISTSLRPKNNSGCWTD
jgi:hypothetical protein